MQILIGDLSKALKEKYINEAQVNANAFEVWKPDEKMSFMPNNGNQLI